VYLYPFTNNVNIRRRFLTPSILKLSSENLTNQDYTVETINTKPMKHTDMEESNNQDSLNESMSYSDLPPSDKSSDTQKMITAAGDTQVQVKPLSDTKKKKRNAKKSPKDVNIVKRKSSNSCTNMSAKNNINSNTHDN